MYFTLTTLLTLLPLIHASPQIPQSPAVRPRASHGLMAREIAVHEERYINSLSFVLPNNTLKLLGFARIPVPPVELEAFEEHYFTPVVHSTLRQDFESHFYDEAKKEIRIYFPVKEGLVRHGGELVETNELGELEIEELEGGDYAVHGRKKTDFVHGVDGNIIKDGIIYLATPPSPCRKLGNVHIYDFGYKDAHDHDHHTSLKPRMLDSADGGSGGENPDATNKGCVANHGGENCSDKYNIHKGRCPEVKSTCMDYNGWFTDCKKEHKFRYFLGSDCSVSVAKGNCWNEMRTAEEGEDGGK